MTLHKRVWAFCKRALRTAHSLAREPRLPRWLRILFVLGCIQIPVLPIDEVFLIIAVLVLATCHRPLLREHWLTAARTVVV